jgi:hypothetical protein
LLNCIRILAVPELERDADALLRSHFHLLTGIGVVGFAVAAKFPDPFLHRAIINSPLFATINSSESTGTTAILALISALRDD